MQMCVTLVDIEEFGPEIPDDVIIMHKKSWSVFCCNGANF